MKKIIELVLLLLAVPVFATVPAGESIRQYFVCNGSTTTFTFTQPVNSASDVLVYNHIIATGNEGGPLVQDTDYTIVATGGDYLNGGVVTISPALESTSRVVIVRMIGQTQETTSGAIAPESIVAALDKLTRQVQDLEDRKDRSIHLQESDASSFDMEIPGLSGRASKYPFFGDDGALTFVDSVDITGNPMSAFMLTMADDASAILARATLGTMDIINVKTDYGALGDGATDDTTALAAAFAAGDNKTIFFPSGTYMISSALTIPIQAIIRGTGFLNSIIQLTDDAPDGTHMLTKSFETVTSVATLIMDIDLVGNWDTVTESGTGDGINLTKVYNLYLERMRIRNCKNNGITATNPAYWDINRSDFRYCRNWGLELIGSGTTVKIRGRCVFNNCGLNQGGAITFTDINKFNIDGAIVEGCNIFYEMKGTLNNAIIIENCYTEENDSTTTLIDMSTASARKVSIINNYLGGRSDSRPLIKAPLDMSADIIVYQGNHLTAANLEEPEKFSPFTNQENYDDSGYFFFTGADSATIATFIIGADSTPTTSLGVANFQIGICATDRGDLSAASSQIMNLHIVSNSADGLQAIIHTGVEQLSWENEPLFYENEPVTTEGAIVGDFGAKIDSTNLGFTNPIVTVSGDRIVSLKVTPVDSTGIFGRVWWRGAGIFLVIGSSLEYPIRIQPWQIEETGGQHDTGANAATLVDSGEAFTVDEFMGYILFNITDNSFGYITTNTATAITAVLEGGTDNDWDVGDFYEVRIFRR